jgi:hypothetical protein
MIASCDLLLELVVSQSSTPTRLPALLDAGRAESSERAFDISSCASEGKGRLGSTEGFGIRVKRGDNQACGIASLSGTCDGITVMTKSSSTVHSIVKVV